MIRFKNFFYFEEKDDPVEEYEKVGLNDIITTWSCGGDCIILFNVIITGHVVVIASFYLMALLPGHVVVIASSYLMTLLPGHVVVIASSYLGAQTFIW